MPLTGRFRFRRTLTGRLVLQVEHDGPPFWPFFQNGARRRRWRDARLESLVRPEIRGLLEFEDYVEQIPEANHSPRIGPLSRRRLPHEFLQPSPGGQGDRATDARPPQKVA